MLFFCPRNHRHEQSINSVPLKARDSKKFPSVDKYLLVTRQDLQNLLPTLQDKTLEQTPQIPKKGTTCLDRFLLLSTGTIWVNTLFLSGANNDPIQRIKKRITRNVLPRVKFKIAFTSLDFGRYLLESTQPYYK